jgi:UDP-galactopyranose mutase
MSRILIVGAGLYGAVCARELHDLGHQVLVIEQREHVGGNCHTRFVEEAGCHEHVYGAHIFHTDSERIWQYVQRFARFQPYVNRVKVRHGDDFYSFPINLLTMHRVFGVRTPAEAREALARDRLPIAEPANLEEHCLASIGPTLYRLFIEGYTTKQWQRSPRELPADIVRRLPVRFNFDDNYFNDRFQGLPVGGYAALFDRLLAGIPVQCGVDFLADRDHWEARFDQVIYTGPIDAYFEHCHGALAYRSLRFERELLPCADHQGTAVVNYTEASVPWTRIIEHKHFAHDARGDCTLITREYPEEYRPGGLACYPILTDANRARHQRYQTLAETLEGKVHFGGRLGAYRYYDMHQVIGAALAQVARLAGGLPAPCHARDAQLMPA